MSHFIWCFCGGLRALGWTQTRTGPSCVFPISPGTPPPPDGQTRIQLCHTFQMSAALIMRNFFQTFNCTAEFNFACAEVTFNVRSKSRQQQLHLGKMAFISPTSPIHAGNLNTLKKAEFRLNVVLSESLVCSAESKDKLWWFQLQPRKLCF